MRSCLLSTAAILALTPAALADAANAEMEREVIVVEATQTHFDSFVYPGLTSTIDQETLDLVQPVDLDDLLRGIAGVDVPGGPRRTGQTISLRGQGRANTTLLLDGARQNFSSAHDGAIFLDPSLLVGVDTVRGPASALYGSGASGGVVAFRSANALDFLGEDDSWGFEIGAGYRSVDEEERGLVTLFGADGRFDYLASLTSRASGDIALGSGDDLPADDRSISSLVKLGAEVSDGVRAELSWQTFSGEAVEPNNGQGVSGVNAFNALVDKEIENDTLTFSFDANPASLPWLDASLTLYRTENSVSEDETGSARQLRRDLETTGIRAQQRFGFTLDAWTGGLTVGGEYFEDKQDGLDTATSDGVRGGAPDASSEFTAVYAQLELDGPAPLGLPGRVIILPGVRFDEFKTRSPSEAATSNDATSARFGLTYAPVDSFNMYINWGEAFRAPSINELYMDGTHFSLPHIVLGAPVFISNEFIANPDLTPEFTETLEIGFSLDLADRAGVDELTLRTAWFETEAEDLIDLSVDFAFDATCFVPPFFAPCSAGTSSSRNVGQAELSGFEAQMQFANGPFSLDASVSTLDGEDKTTGAALGSLTPARLFLDGRYRFDAQRLILGSRIEWAGKYDQPAETAEHRDGYTVVDLYARWQPLVDNGLTLNAGIENAFDEDYERVFAGVSEAGRSLRLDVSWRRTF
ncbi:TonB-dependent receptor [Maricaulis sp.]|uniref:TonB-dependent receptor domain-containing protein n=1 Tax=Maricaulis sp. TaxID=1486257 RepID=UPI002610FF86|nr:TonB-dependent receptor [Maricaulis sp.]